MLPSERIELAIYRYVKEQGTERRTALTSLAAAVISSIPTGYLGEGSRLVIERLRALHIAGHFRLSKYTVAAHVVQRVCEERRKHPFHRRPLSEEVDQAVQRLLAEGSESPFDRMPYSEEGNMPIGQEDFFIRSDFIVEITPEGRRYFENLEEEASAERRNLGEKILEKLDEEAGVTLTLSKMATTLPGLQAMPQAERYEVLALLRATGDISYISPDGPLTISIQGERKVQMARQPQRTLRKQEVIMRDKYEIHGQAGAVGPHAHVHDVDFVQLWNEISPSIDISILAQQLTRLREAMRARAAGPEHDVAIGAVASAEIEAQKGNGQGVLEYLSRADKWALDLAREIGVQVAADTLKKALGV
jgi:hypothetical protein